MTMEDFHSLVVKPVGFFFILACIHWVVTDIMAQEALKALAAQPDMVRPPPLIPDVIIPPLWPYFLAHGLDLVVFFVLIGAVLHILWGWLVRLLEYLRPPRPPPQGTRGFPPIRRP